MGLFRAARNDGPVRSRRNPEEQFGTAVVPAKDEELQAGSGRLGLGPRGVEIKQEGNAAGIELVAMLTHVRTGLVVVRIATGAPGRLEAKVSHIFEQSKRFRADERRARAHGPR